MADKDTFDKDNLKQNGNEDFVITEKIVNKRKERWIRRGFTFLFVVLCAAAFGIVFRISFALTGKKIPGSLQNNTEYREEVYLNKRTTPTPGNSSGNLNDNSSENSGITGIPTENAKTTKKPEYNEQNTMPTVAVTPKASGEAVTPVVPTYFATPGIIPTATPETEIKVTLGITGKATPTPTETVRITPHITMIVVPTPAITQGIRATATPEALVTATPKIKVTMSPEVTITVMPSESPDVTKKVTPGVTPDVTKEVLPEVTKAVSPEVTKSVSPEVTKAASQIAPGEVPGVTGMPVGTDNMGSTVTPGTDNTGTGDSGNTGNISGSGDAGNISGSGDAGNTGNISGTVDTGNLGDNESSDDSEGSMEQEKPEYSYVKFMNEVMSVAESVQNTIASVDGINTGISFLGESYEIRTNTTGLVIAQDNVDVLILTDYSSVKDAKRVEVTFTGSDEVLSASVYTYDTDLELAIIGVHISAIPETVISNIQYAAFCSEETVTTGIPVFELGRANGYPDSLSFGIISAANNSYNAKDAEIKYFTTDWNMYSAASGFVFNMDGFVIGMLNHTIEKSSSYTAPCFTVLSALDDEINLLLNGKKLVSFGIYGIEVPEAVKEMSAVTEGIYLTLVNAGTPAYTAGLRSGDIITEINGKSINTMAEFMDILSASKVSEALNVVYMRNYTDGIKSQSAYVMLVSK